VQIKRSIAYYMACFYLPLADQRQLKLRSVNINVFRV